MVTENKSRHRKLSWGTKNSRGFCWGSNPRPSDHESGALPLSCIFNGGRYSYSLYACANTLPASSPTCICTSFTITVDNPHTYSQETAWQLSRVSRAEDVSCVREEGTTSALMSSSWPPRPTVERWLGFTCMQRTSATSTSFVHQWQ